MISRTFSGFGRKRKKRNPKFCDANLLGLQFLVHNGQSKGAQRSDFLLWSLVSPGREENPHRFPVEALCQQSEAPTALYVHSPREFTHNRGARFILPHMYMHTHVHACLHKSGWSESSFIALSPYWLRQSDMLIWIISLAISVKIGIKGESTPPNIYLGSEDPNSSPHARAISALATERCFLS